MEEQKVRLVLTTNQKNEVDTLLMSQNKMLGELKKMNELLQGILKELKHPFGTEDVEKMEL